MVAPAVIALIVIVAIAVILFVVTLSLFIATSNDLGSGSDKTALLAAGAMIGLSIPLIVASAIFGILYFNGMAKGKRNAGTLWTFIILGVLAGLMVLIASIIGFVVANGLSDYGQQRNLRAAGAMGLIGSLFFVIAFIVLAAFARSKIPAAERKKYVRPTKTSAEKPHA